MPQRQITVSYASDEPKGQRWLVTYSEVGLDGFGTQIHSKHPTKKEAKAEARRLKRPGDAALAWTKGLTNSEPL